MTVPGLAEEAVQNIEDVLLLMEKGQQNRTVGSTFMNADSSRSHAILRIVLYQAEEGDVHSPKSVLSLIDLAGKFFSSNYSLYIKWIIGILTEEKGQRGYLGVEQ